MNKTEFTKRYRLKKTSKFDLRMLMFFKQNHYTKIEELRSKVALAYNDYSSAHGELFEDAIVSMEEADLTDIGKDKKKALKNINYFALFALAFFSLIVFAVIKPAEGELWKGLVAGLIFVIVFAVLRLFTIKNYDQILRSKSKRVVKGVITDLVETESEEFAFEISMREMVLVKQEYRNFLPGDIITMVIFSEFDSSVKRYITKIGSLIEDQRSKS